MVQAIERNRYYFYCADNFAFIEIILSRRMRSLGCQCAIKLASSIWYLNCFHCLLSVPLHVICIGRRRRRKTKSARSAVHRARLFNANELIVSSFQLIALMNNYSAYRRSRSLEAALMLHDFLCFYKSCYESQLLEKWQFRECPPSTVKVFCCLSRQSSLMRSHKRV